MPRKIDAFYVWLQIEPEGENMTYVPIRGINRRLFATDTERIRRLRPYAVRLHEVLGYPLVLARFSHRAPAGTLQIEPRAMMGRIDAVYAWIGTRPDGNEELCGIPPKLCPVDMEEVDFFELDLDEAMRQRDLAELFAKDPNSRVELFRYSRREDLEELGQRAGFRAQPGKAREGRWQMPGMDVPPPPPPLYLSWDDYLGRTSEGERIARCAKAAHRANRKRLLSEVPKVRVTAQQVWAVVEAAHGRCAHCGSLAIEGRPSNPVTGAPVAWAHVGRRIGSLEHIKCRFAGGDNELANLAWSCLWCNTWPKERRRLASDHGGYCP